MNIQSLCAIPDIGRFLAPTALAVAGSRARQKTSLCACRSRDRRVHTRTGKRPQRPRAHGLRVETGFTGDSPKDLRAFSPFRGRLLAPVTSFVATPSRTPKLSRLWVSVAVAEASQRRASFSPAARLPPVPLPLRRRGRPAPNIPRRWEE